MGISADFKSVIKEKLDFDASGNVHSHLLYTAGFEKKKGILAKEYFVLEAAAKHHADAVYFRRFGDGRAPIPQILLYDNTKAQHTEKKLTEIHKNLWSSCLVPMFMVIEKSSVRIYDCRIPVDVKGDELKSKFETLQMANDAIRSYSAKLFDNGTFWEQEEIKNKFLSKTSAYQKLVEGLRDIRNAYLKDEADSGLSKAIVHKLLVRCVLIKYLEERGNGAGVRFAQNFFQEELKVDSFIEVLKTKGKILKAFDKLGEHFNGRVFRWDDPKERKLLASKDLSRLAYYLDGKEKNQQLLLWSQFSFEHLPVEVISSIYETLLKEDDEKDVVYTPEPLVNLLVDECMPADDYDGKENFKVFDGTCGSGIFLVKAFKRMIQWKRYERLKEGSSRINITPNDAGKILERNIFGVEIKEDAQQLTIFSLAVAMCDVLTPKQIWTEMKFPDLYDENIQHKDFFSYRTTAPTEKFDLVIGNPPFEHKKKDFNDIITKNKLEKPEVAIPNNQLALLYLDQVMPLVKKEGRLCLILPAGPFIYNNTLEFRANFCSKYNVEQVLDFTNLSDALFEGQANVPVVALYAQNTKPSDEDIAHITINRTKSAKDRIYFEIDHYDFHWVTKEEALANPYVWKANLLGGGRIIDLINRFEQYPTISDFLKEKKKAGWVSGEGYIVGHDGTKSEKELKEIGFLEADYLHNRRTLVTSEFDENTTTETLGFEKETNNLFRRPRNPKLYEPPFVIIKENFGDEKLAVLYSEKPFIYKDSMVGIAAPKTEKEKLLAFSQTLDSNHALNRFLIAIRSNKLLLSRATVIKKEDILALPFSSEKTVIKLSFSESIIQHDILHYTFDHLSKGENSIISQPAEQKDLKAFGKVYCKALNSIYEMGNRKFRMTNIVKGTGFYACEFHLSTKEGKEPIIDSTAAAETKLTNLLQAKHGSNALINRVVKLYEKDKVTLIKPMALRYWLKSIALRDVDETLDEILDAAN